MSDAAKKGLVPSNAGMRLIALLTIFNKGDFARLRQYVEDNYHPALLADVPARTQLAELKATYRLAGKLRVEQVVAVGKHAALVLLASQRGGVYLTQMVVEEDYPHRITGLQVQALEGATPDDDAHMPVHNRNEHSDET
jgi:hypothetical protein